MEEQKKEKEINGGYLAMEIFSELKVQLKRQNRIILILLLVLFITNVAWLYVFQSYDYVTQDGDGVNYFNSRTEGDVYNGAENQGQEEGKEQGQ